MMGRNVNRTRCVALVVLVLLAQAGCSPATPMPATAEGFSITLTDPRIKPEQLAALSHLELEKEPILAGGDIVSYTKATHEIVLTASAAERIGGLQVPTSGRAFAVCVDGLPVYTGAFWASYSSQSYDGVVIDPLLVTKEHPVIQIQLGYPGPDFFRGVDPRSDPRVFAALERADKLK
jgi:hypothetical protein